MIKILIADDHAIVRKGLTRILEDTADMKVAGEAVDGPETLQKLRSHPYDILVLDISMPGMNGIDVIKTVKSEQPKLPVVVLSMHAEEKFALRGLKAGAAGYVTKERTPEELINAIRKVVAGKKYISPRLAEILADNLDADAKLPRHALLSDREFQILRRLAKGQVVTEIAAELALSVKTVSTYRTRILKKLGLEKTVDLILYAIRNHLDD